MLLFSFDAEVFIMKRDGLPMAGTGSTAHTPATPFRQPIPPRYSPSCPAPPQSSPLHITPPSLAIPSICPTIFHPGPARTTRIPILISSSTCPCPMPIPSTSHPYPILIPSSSHPHPILIPSSPHPHPILIPSPSLRHPSAQATQAPCEEALVRRSRRCAYPALYA